MTRYQLVEHAPGAPGLRHFGLGPDLRPSRGLQKMRNLLEKHAFWAKNRKLVDLKAMLAGSTVVVTLWRGKRMVGFGRATSDNVYRAVLWDVVVAGDLQGRGLGRRVVEGLLRAKAISNAEHVYLMTTSSAGFYKQLGFVASNSQILLVRRNKKSG